jgi:hypothetical protein
MGPRLASAFASATHSSRETAPRRNLEFKDFEAHEGTCATCVESFVGSATPRAASQQPRLAVTETLRGKERSRHSRSALRARASVYGHGHGYGLELRDTP